MATLHNEVQPLIEAIKEASSTDHLECAIQNVLYYHANKPSLQSNLLSHIKDMAKSNETCLFWSRFIESDIFAYISLFISIRNCDWQLRIASIKLMAPIFFAFDRPIYQRLVSTHLADLLCLPSELQQYFDHNGAFAVHITSHSGHATALDETHETVINRIIKNTVTRPNPELMEHACNAFPFRSACQNQLRQQLGLDTEATEENKGIKIANSNVAKMVDLIDTKHVLSTDDTDSTLANKFTGISAMPDQQHDLLAFRQIGQAEFENHIECRILRKPSAQPPSRLKKLKTFTISKDTKQKAKQINREKKIIETCTQKQLALCRSGQPNTTLNPPYIPLPRALVNEDGQPHKANKASPTNFFKNRYKEASVVINCFPPQWTPDSVLLEGMFMIQTTPALGVTKYSNYCIMLLHRFVIPHFKNGVKQVHVIFDSPNSENESPKEIERRQRDMGHMVTPNHEHDQITESGEIPTNWRGDIINCRTCKQNLCHFLCTHMLVIIPQFLKEGQAFFCSGGFRGDLRDKCISVTGNSKQVMEAMQSNTEETDLRIWLHCKHAWGTRKLIYSPDTDVYHIGLPLVSQWGVVNDVYIQQRPSLHENSRFLSMSALIQAINTDPDLAYIPLQMRPQIIQTLYVVTGCDYISFFKNIGKLFFMQVFYKHSKFISSGLDTPGTLGDISDVNPFTGTSAILRRAQSIANGRWRNFAHLK